MWTSGIIDRLWSARRSLADLLRVCFVSPEQLREYSPCDEVSRWLPSNSMRVWSLRARVSGRSKQRGLKKISQTLYLVRGAALIAVESTQGGYSMRSWVSVSGWSLQRGLVNPTPICELWVESNDKMLPGMIQCSNRHIVSLVVPSLQSYRGNNSGILPRYEFQKKKL